MNRNSISQILYVIGFIELIIGLIAGFSFMSVEGGFGFVIIITAVVSAIFIFGFAEIIRLLDEINKKIENKGSLPIITGPPLESKVQRTSNSIIRWEISGEDKARILDYFEKRNQRIREIIITPEEDYCIVDTNEGLFLVEVGGFIPEVNSIEKLDQHPIIKEWYLNLNRNE